MFWKKLIYLTAGLIILMALGVFNHTAASSFSSREAISQPGHKFGGRKILKKKNKRNKRLLRKWGLGQINEIRSEISC